MRTAAYYRRRTAVRVLFWATTAAWLAPHVARQDGAWLLALTAALLLVAAGVRQHGAPRRPTVDELVTAALADPGDRDNSDGTGDALGGDNALLGAGSWFPSGDGSPFRSDHDPS